VWGGGAFKKMTMSKKQSVYKKLTMSKKKVWKKNDNVKNTILTTNLISIVIGGVSQQIPNCQTN
jgi:hypothetical protein